MIKTFKAAGLATDKNGNTTVRYANNVHTRTYKLKQDGFTNLNFITTDEPKTKKVLCNIMLNLIQYDNDKDIIVKELNRLETRMTTLSKKLTLINGNDTQ